MLLDLREKVRNSKPLKYSLITLISIPFVLVGIGSYFSGGTAAPIAEVNGQPIDQQQWDRAYQQQRQQLARMFGGQLPEAFANEALLRDQALQQLITQQVLESEVVEQKFAVGDATLGRAIRNLPNFQVDGRFDAEAYQTQLRSSGMSVPMFEQSFRDDTALNQFRTGISNTAFTLPQESERLAALGRQTRTIEAVKFDFAKAREGIEVTEEEIVAYFDANKDDYQFPERVKIQYLELDSAAVASEIAISDEQAQTYYDENQVRYVQAAQREASHILLEGGEVSEADLIARIEEIKARIEGGEEFSDLAAELSDDIGSAAGGGSLGVITTGAMVPEFEEAVFALDTEGALSGPVVTEFGVHLIKLDSLTEEVTTPFEEVKTEIIDTMQQDEADREFFDLRDLLVELTFDNPGSLDPAADATGLEILTSDWLDNETDSGPVLSNPAVTAAAFSPDVLDDENNSDLIEIDGRHVVVLRVLEHEDPRPKTLEDVREELVEALKGERATESLSELAEDVMEKLAAGDTASAAADGNELADVLAQELLDRQSTVFDRNVTARIFSLPYPGDELITDKATLANGDLLVLRLDAVQTPEATSSDDEEPVAAPVAGVLDAGANPQLGSTEFEALLQSLRGAADVEVLAPSAAAIVQ
ncbi:MAG: SurA N-terminal domain-containing protein [Granulosicoccus sp.]